MSTARPTLFTHRKSALTGSFSGEHKENYQEFSQFLKQYLKSLASKSPQDQAAEVASLGQVSKSDEHYFDPTPEAQAYGQEFLTAFWGQAANLKAIDAKQRAKFLETKGRCSIPQCFSFVPVHAETSLGEENFCLLSISSWGSAKNPEIWQHIKAFVTEYNNSAGAKTRFELLDLASENFHELLGSALEEKQSKPADPTLECSEKGFGAELVKAFFDRASQGKKMEIRGVLNVVCWPYEEELTKNYGKHVITLDKLLSKNGGATLKTVVGDKAYHAPILCCCKNCQANKPALLNAAVAAKAYGNLLYQQKFSSPSRPRREHKDHITSPAQVKITPVRKRTHMQMKLPPSCQSIFLPASATSSKDENGEPKRARQDLEQKAASVSQSKPFPL